MHRKAEVLIAQEKYDAAIEACNACLKDAHADEEKQPEWIAVRFRLAEALSKKGETLPADSPEQRRLLAEAREAYRLVAKSPGEFQAAARRRRRPWHQQPATQATETLHDRKGRAANFSSRIRFRERSALILQRGEARDSERGEKQSAGRARVAGPNGARQGGCPPLLSHRDDAGGRGHRPKLVNEVRYFLCWLYWEAEDYYRAAVLGEFLARRYPDHPAASSAAKISMASFERLYNQAIAAGKQEGRRRFRSAANGANGGVHRPPLARHGGCRRGVRRAGKFCDSQRQDGGRGKAARAGVGAIAAAARAAARQRDVGAVSRTFAAGSGECRRVPRRWRS